MDNDASKMSRVTRNNSSAVAEMGDRVRAKWAEMSGLLYPFDTKWPG